MKIGVFVDTNNIYYNIRKIYQGRNLDYKKYLNDIVNDHILYRACAYSIQHVETFNFVECLSKIGYQIRTKIINQTNYRNNNVDITLDVVKLIDKLDVIVLGSQSLDLIPLIEWIKNRGIKCFVYACNISNQIKEVADYWEEIKKDILELKIDNKNSIVNQSVNKQLIANQPVNKHSVNKQSNADTNTTDK